MTVPNTDWMCQCDCHRAIGDATGGVWVTDPVAAATACSKCLGKHAPALLTKPTYLPPSHWTPDSDADATGGEGAE